jgi:hypothetical protein
MGEQLNAARVIRESAIEGKPFFSEAVKSFFDVPVAAAVPAAIL